MIKAHNLRTLLPMCFETLFYRVAAVVLALSATPVFAQNVTVQNYGGENTLVYKQAIGVQDIPYYYDSFENVYGENAPGMEAVASVALQRHPQDRFEWWKKPLPGGFSANSCAAAASNLYDATYGSGVLPPGWEMRQVGTLGSLTTAENAFASDYGSLYAWYATGQFPDPEFDALNPPSYAHSLTMVKTDNGEYYTVDTWGDDVTIKRVYPIDDDAKYFSEDPNETDLSQSAYKLSGLDERGRAWDEPFVGPLPPEPPEELESEPPPSSEDVEVEVLTSADPNDKTGLLGIGDDRFIALDEQMHYVIRFENMANASAPAQEVLVRDTLDTRVFDLSSFELGDFRFGSRRIRVPPGLTAYTTRVPIQAPLEVIISASLVQETGIVTWRFTTIDTNTGDLPFDPLDGFLPPNENPPEGEGSVAFRIDAREGLGSGTEIRNQARIIFDLNEPIDTPPWVNTVDIEPPSTRVVALAPIQSDSVFTVSWGGTDAEAGISRYDVFVSVNGGAFYQWLRRYPSTVTEETFVGRADSSYAFYSIATDGTGNREAPKTVADASTAIVVAGEEGASGLPPEVALAAPFPNPAPASRPVEIHYSLPEPQQVDVRVFDVRGREIAHIVSEERAAGWHRVAWNAGAQASGVYVVQLRTGSKSLTRRITLIPR